MAKVLIATVSVFNAGMIVEPGATFSCEDDYAAKLVDNKSAKLYVAPKEKEETPKEPTSFDDLTVKVLLEIATKHKVEIGKDDKKAEIITALVAADVKFDENI
ncbi:MAG TPA: hypothetical protein K8V56_20635 [Sporosarcina psychrophila]|uniref:Uncharacterized protein n=1 Tax=Sporosarcina psychrophila TaxID=1476 RepID=A0A921G371_SPOPS|nr:hypothetical protein [Sporosarcina psychrophila]